MTNVVFKLIVFSILLNFAVGIMSNAIPAYNLVNDPTIGRGLWYNGSYSDQFIIQMNDSINPSNELEDAQNGFDRLLDSIGLGIINKIKPTIDKYMFGFTNLVLRPLFGGLMEPEVESILFGGLNIIITMGYILGAIWLFTGKSLTGDAK